MTDSPPTGRTALYRLYDAEDQLLYIGVAIDPERRWRQHANDKAWWPEVRRREVEWHPTPAAAYVAETRAIKAEDPKRNVACTQEHNERQAVKHRANAPQARVKGKVAQEAYLIRVRIRSELTDQGVPWAEATAEGQRAEQAYKDASGVFRR